MHTSIILLAVSLAGICYAWTYPDCEPDNCYRELTDSRFYAEAEAFCPSYLAGSVTNIPSDFSNCGGDSTAVSSACSCVTYSMTYTALHSTPISIIFTTSPSSREESTAQSEGATKSSTSLSDSTQASATSPVLRNSSGSVTQYTTSTIYSNIVKVVGSCTVTTDNCPESAATVYTTTEIVAVSTTVCPMTETSTPSSPAYVSVSNSTMKPTWNTSTMATTTPISNTSVSTVFSSTITTSIPKSAVTAGASRRSSSIIIAAAGLFAVAIM